MVFKDKKQDNIAVFINLFYKHLVRSCLVNAKTEKVK